MTSMAVTKHEEPLLSIDESRKYSISAGQCDKCGNFKTWDFKVVNQKSGKSMPGHVTRDGYKINDGDCPFYSMVASRKPREAEPAPAPVHAPAPARHAPPYQAPCRAFVEPGDGGVVVLRSPAGSITLDREGALLACAAILSLLATRGE